MAKIVMRWLGSRKVCESCGAQVSVVRMEIGNKAMLVTDEPDTQAFLVCLQCMPSTRVERIEQEGKTMSTLHLA